MWSLGNTLGLKAKPGDPEAELLVWSHPPAWSVDHWDLGSHKGTLRQAEGAAAGMISELTFTVVGRATVRQAGNRDHPSTGILQRHSQWSTGTGGSVEPHSGRAVTGATRGQRVKGVTLWQGGQQGPHWDRQGEWETHR